MQDQVQIRFSVSDSFSVAREIFANHGLFFVAIYFVCGLPEAIVSGLLGDSGWVDFVGLVLIIVGAAIAEPAITWATLAKLEDPGVSLVGTVEKGLDYFGPVLVASLIVGVAFIIGFIALIVPGLIVYALVFFAVPAIVGENCGAIESLERSAALGRGIRSEVFFLMFIYLVLYVLIAVLPGLLLDKLPYVGAFLDLILRSGIGAFGSVLAAVAFRQIKMSRGMPMDVGQT